MQTSKVVVGNLKGIGRSQNSLEIENDVGCMCSLSSNFLTMFIIWRHIFVILIQIYNYY